MKHLNGFLEDIAKLQADRKLLEDVLDFLGGKDGMYGVQWVIDEIERNRGIVTGSEEWRKNVQLTDRIREFRNFDDSE